MGLAVVVEKYHFHFFFWWHASNFAARAPKFSTLPLKLDQIFLGIPPIFSELDQFCSDLLHFTCKMFVLQSRLLCKKNGWHICFSCWDMIYHAFHVWKLETHHDTFLGKNDVIFKMSPPSHAILSGTICRRGEGHVSFFGMRRRVEGLEGKFLFVPVTCFPAMIHFVSLIYFRWMIRFSVMI